MRLVHLLVFALLSSPVWADRQAQAEFLQGLFQASPELWQSELKAHRGLLDDSFFEAVVLRVQWAVRQKRSNDILRFWVVLRHAEDAVDREPRVGLVTDFVLPGDFERKELGDPEAPAPTRFGWAEFDYSQGLYHQSERAFARLQSEGYRAQECVRYLQLIHQELSRFGEL